jgi:hypothetical protein
LLAAIQVQFGMGQVILESDDFNVTTELQSDVLDFASIGVLVWEQKNSCFVLLNDFQFSFSQWECNSVAHVLARHGACPTFVGDNADFT